MERGVVFSLQDRHFALPLDAVTRVVRAVEITPLPDAPEGVCGVIDVQGEIVPVIDLRSRFALPRRELAIDDQFLVARTAKRVLALWVDRVSGVAVWGEGDFVDAAALVPGSRRLRGVARGEGGLMLVHDLDALLSPDEAAATAATAATAEGGAGA